MDGLDRAGCVPFTAQLVERDPGVLLRLEATVLVGVGVDAGREERDDPAEDDAEHRHHDEHLDQGIAALVVPQSVDQLVDHDRDETSLRACSACARLSDPIPQRFVTRLSAVISVRSAAAPCHQPISAPVTIQLCW